MENNCDSLLEQEIDYAVKVPNAVKTKLHYLTLEERAMIKHHLISMETYFSMEWVLERDLINKNLDHGNMKIENIFRLASLGILDFAYWRDTPRRAFRISTAGRSILDNLVNQTRVSVTTGNAGSLTLENF